MPQLENLSFQDVLNKYPERRLALEKVPFKTMMNMVRRLKPLPAVQARNYIIAASENPSAYDDANNPLTFPVLISQPLRAYMVGTLNSADRVVIANVTIPSDARVREIDAVIATSDKPIPAFATTVMELDTAVELSLYSRYMIQVGAVDSRSPGPQNFLHRLWLGTNVTQPKRPYRFFVDQGNALRYAGIKK